MKQKMKLRRKVTSYVLALVMVISTMTGIVPGTSQTAQAATITVTYLDADGNQKSASATQVTSSSSEVTWSAGWYVVNSDVTISKGVTVSGDVHLILVDGKTLKIESGSYSSIYMNNNTKITIYGQSEGTGTLEAKGNYYGIRTGSGTTITINGGIVNASGGSDSYSDGINLGTSGVHISGEEYNYSLTINNGKVTATGKKNGIYAQGASFFSFLYITAD